MTARCQHVVAALLLTLGGVLSFPVGSEKRDPVSCGYQVGRLREGLGGLWVLTPAASYNTSGLFWF